MKLSNYAPASNEVLLELREYSEGAIITINPQHDKVMKVLKVGPTVTALNPLTGEKVAVGDYVIMVQPNLLTFDFDPEETGGKKIKCVQGKEFGIASYYKPSPDEKKYFPVLNPADDLFPSQSRDLNVIDNPGIDKSPYLKEEREREVRLDTDN